ncbi:acyl-CoA thioesterase [Halobacillus mangrovi]|uniref:Thioesterase n=1 Tax=Halobacillus mangrovi TaxID=402384 RepID=A0A1W5ZT45_9BACI|nr:thioesterase family protein [Halobacillus mangrovi]ARI76474.1 thioesterase [Halobacillus mangrovi]
MKHEVPVSVRFCETDMAGHVNNTSYFIYLEEARGKFFEEVIPNHSSSFGRFIIASTTCDFVSQAYFGQSLTISSWVSNIGNKSFRFGHRIEAEDTGNVIAEAEATIVHFNYETQKSESIPIDLRSILENHLVLS